MWVMDLVNSSLKHWICKASAICTVFASIGLHFILKFLLQDLPGGPVVKNLPANAGDTGPMPGTGRSHIPQGNWTCELQLLSLSILESMLHKRSHCKEKPEHHNEE